MPEAPGDQWRQADPTSRLAADASGGHRRHQDGRGIAERGDASAESVAPVAGEEQIELLQSIEPMRGERGWCLPPAG